MTTEEETFSKLQTNLLGTTNYTLFDLCKDYHQERLKSSLPSEQEIEGIIHLKYSKIINSTVLDEAEKIGYKQGFKDALTLLTKGDR